MRAFIYCLIGLLLLAPAVASPQTYQGGVRGAVRDADGGVLPGTMVTLTNEATGVARTAVTNERGEYVFASVAPATYNLGVELTGFAPFRREGLQVGVQTFLVQDVTLQVGGIAESVTVTGETPLIETATASIASAIDRAQMEVLPTPGRNVYIMAVTTPNVVHAGDPVFVRMQDQTNASLLSLGGGPMRANNYTLDGVSIVDIRNRSSINPSFESLEEMKVQISTYDAEMGRTSAGVFNAIHRSGSNNWGGSALYQSRPSFGRSRTFFEDRDDVDAPEAPYDLWGGSFGGPIARNKTFFWWAHEGYKNIDTRNDRVFLPTRAMANGNFSSLGFPIYDPFTGQPFPGNVIPANRLDPVGVALANQLADLQEVAGSQDVSATALLNNIAWQMSGNINHSFSDGWQISGTFMYYKSEEPDNKYYTDILGETPVYDTGSAILFRDVQVVAINSTHIPSDDSVLTLRYGYARFNDSPTNPAFNTQDAIALGFNADQMNAIGSGIQQFPYITADGYGVNDSTHGSWTSADIVFKSQEASGVYSKFVGSHTLKFGAQFRTLGVDWFRAAAMNFDFPARFTAGPGSPGDGIATMVLGVPTAGSAEIAAAFENYLNYYAGFVQDDWRVNEDLVVNLGLRLEHETGLGERSDQMIYGWDYDAPFPVSAPGMNLTGGILYAGVDGNPERTTDPASIKVGPRAGFSYSLNEATVLRGGYGVFWAPHTYAGASINNYAALGFAAQTPFISFERGGTGTLSNPFPEGVNQPSGNTNGRLQNVGQSLHFIDQFRESPYIQKWSFDIQREMGGNVALKVGYVGSKGTDLTVAGTSASRTNINQLAPEFLSMGSALNNQVANPFFGIEEFGPISSSPTIRQGQLLRPFPQFLDVFAHQRSTSRSRYDAIRLELEKRFRGTWGARINYTWANQRDNIYDTDQTPVQDTTVIVYRTGFEEDDFGPARISIPHQINLNGLYRFPSPDGGAAEVILGGWSASVTAIIRDGFPVLIRQSNNWGAGFGYNHIRPNTTGADPNTSGSTADRVDGYLNPAAYEQVGSFQFGNSPHTNGDVRTPWLYDWDVSFEKSTNIASDANLTLRFEFINFFNQPNWRGPRSVVGLSNFGVITGQLGFPRTFQFMAKLTF
jgi:hypothetical protein